MQRRPASFDCLRYCGAIALLLGGAPLAVAADDDALPPPEVNSANSAVAENGETEGETEAGTDAGTDAGIDTKLGKPT